MQMSLLVTYCVFSSKSTNVSFPLVYMQYSKVIPKKFSQQRSKLHQQSTACGADVAYVSQQLSHGEHHVGCPHHLNGPALLPSANVDSYYPNYLPFIASPATLGKKDSRDQELNW